ncbi:MAG: ABC transporter substrate-binding protein [Mesorhizobium sp.]|uniref:ABC transporter substrate-binding protein n=1 Tax=Mesorhizobium sp. TaxID=1871066 RepID=UPI000FE55638|nr:ABC transporter substrate-binding protein [Mesorhizobium sp.]RWB60690.1 MAG: ABC transporter substrate-binding protein [Mesorhizobium sp.]TIU34825.1 MAG: ABC transporter substrate-binding protein [Mesorhizobium sp.]TKB18087.1 MAG: ABC transporter substrate-binding protein [Mesorhizobium sp.]
MRRMLLAAVAAIALGGTALADTIKVGVIGPFSGPFAIQGKNFKAGIDAWTALNGAKVGNDDVEIVYRDLPAANPAQAKSLAQDLVVKEHVQYLAGFYFTPDAMAVTPLLEQANVPMVIMNAATSAIVTKSPLIVRTSFTLWQTSVPMAKVAAQRGIKKVITAVSDYGPGVDAETAFATTFKADGGQIVESIRMPLSTTDFSPIMQRVKDSGAEAVFAFLPSGPTTLGFLKSYNENGLKQAGIQFLAPGDLTQESDLPALGDTALGVTTTFHYSIAHDSGENKKFVAAARTAIGNPAELSFPSVSAYDGMRVIYKMIEATGGKQDAKKAVDAVKGMAWESPRGPVSIDPESRHITQNIYLREVAKAEDGTYYNKEIQTFPNMTDPGLAAAK